MKRTKLFCTVTVALLLHLFAYGDANAQNVIKQWSRLAESPAMIDVDYQIIQCSGSTGAELYLQVFNEKPAADVAKFDIVVTDVASNQSFTTTINKSMGVAEMVRAKCGSTAANDLKIALPSTYDPANLSVSLTFIP